MHRRAVDQAEGLRRLAENLSLRVVPFVSACDGVGKTGIVMNVAAALVSGGHAVLILDEDGGNIVGRLGLRARFDLVHVLKGECRIEEVVLRAADGTAVIPAARAMAMLPGLGPEAGGRLLAAFEWIAHAFDMMLIDAVPGMSSRLVAAGIPTQDPTLVLSGNASAITETYVLLKRLNHEWGCRRFRIIISKARGEAEALAIYRNLAGAARRYLGVRLELSGVVPLDLALCRANAQCRTVLDVFPDSQAAGAIRGAAENLRDAGLAPVGGGSIRYFVQRLTGMGRQRLAGQAA